MLEVKKEHQILQLNVKSDYILSNTKNIEYIFIFYQKNKHKKLHHVDKHLYLELPRMLVHILSAKGNKVLGVRGRNHFIRLQDGRFLSHHLQGIYTLLLIKQQLNNIWGKNFLI